MYKKTMENLIQAKIQKIGQVLRFGEKATI